MKNGQIKILGLLLLALVLPFAGSSQDSLAFELKYDVHRFYPGFSISNEKLNEAKTLSDLNQYYKSSWVKSYVSVETVATVNGREVTVQSENDILTQKQKDLMSRADAATGIKVNVRYIPDNTLSHNDVKETGFTFTVDPDSEASYPGGKQQLKHYLKSNAIDNIPEDIFTKYQLTAVKFAIDEQGKVVDAFVFESSKNENADQLLLETIMAMPRWKPAEYANGTKVKQEFVLAVGDMESCTVNLLNIRWLSPE
jgi:hypothetical protein